MQSYLTKDRGDPILFKTVGGNLRGEVLLGMLVGERFLLILRGGDEHQGRNRECSELRWLVVSPEGLGREVSPLGS